MDELNRKREGVLSATVLDVDATVLVLPDVIQVCAAPSGGDFAPFWPENGCTLYPFWSGIGCGFRGNYGSV